jgi:ATP-dependent DNA helicase RecG
MNQEKHSDIKVNIGRADTLGSGMRNLYRYTELYSGAEPILSEGDVFQITIPIKKAVVAPEKSVVENNKISWDIILHNCNEMSYNLTVIDNLKEIYEEISTNQIFGITDIESIIGCAKSTAGGLMRRLRDMSVVVPVKGKGKGKYRFKNESE